MTGLLLSSLVPSGCIGVPSESDSGLLDRERILPREGAVRVNLQIDAEREDVEGLKNIVNELLRRGIRTTVYVTAEYANRNALLVHDLYDRGFEIALHGFYTGEQLASMTYEEQKDLLTRARLALAGCQPCGTDRPITGFRPQYFSQNEDTYRVLDELGIAHNSGFKAGELFIEGHEEQAIPYAVEGHSFYAVPFTTVEQAGNVLYLCDIACAMVSELTAEQWLQALRSGFQQAVDNDQPMVVLFHGWYTGDQNQYDYWQSFVSFLDEVQDQAAFVTTEELVRFYTD